MKLASHKLITILGPTACGKTGLAVKLASVMDGEIISADSRQVFRGMDIGTGKDLEDYVIDGVQIPYHLIDICEPGTEYNVYRFMNDFSCAWNGILQRGRNPILCGGTGLYIESIVKGYQLPDAPIDEDYRKSLEPFSDEELTERLASYIKLHNHTDTETRDRLIRALEIEEFRQKYPEKTISLPEMEHCIIGLSLPREVVVERIGARLRQRLDNGMIEEIDDLLKRGVPAERLLRYGLEYKHVTLYLTHQCTWEEMYEKLYTDIRRFSKRQMTWFRRMERQGIKINWIDGTDDVEKKCEHVMEIYQGKR